MCYTYIIKGKKDYYYCGITKDINKRYAEHNTGKSKSTRRNLPYSLKFCYENSTRSLARKLEEKIKRAGIRKWYYKNIKYGNHDNMVITHLIGNTEK